MRGLLLIASGILTSGLMMAAPCMPAGADTLIPVEKFAQIPAATTARLSPDGTRLALIASMEGRQVLYVHPIVDGVKGSKVVTLGDFQVRWVRWKDNDHLVAGLFSTVDRMLAQNGEYQITRMIAVDSGGNHSVNIGEPPDGFVSKTPIALGHVHPQFQDEVLSMLPQDPDHILQAVVDDVPIRGKSITPALYSVEIATGRHERLSIPAPLNLAYHIERSGLIRLGVGIEGGDYAVYVRDNADDPWRVVHRHKVKDTEIFNPLAFIPDRPQSLYVFASNAPERKGGLWSFDTATGRFDELIDENADPNGRSQMSEGELICYSRKDGTLHYLDPAWESDYLSVRKAVGDKILSIVDRTADGSRVLFEIARPHYPKSWWVLDRTVTPINLWPAIESYPDIEEDQIAPVREVTFKARDGLEIPAYLTLPAGYKGGEIPFVVLPHGGPYVCEGKDFDYESQFIASRGWGVLRPQFRGTTCYGTDFEKKGFHEWGLAMQDDVTDATQWLIDEKMADPQRICIVGGSYGGYAALEGAVKEPGLYRCAAAWAPVTDLFKFRIDLSKIVNSRATLDRLGNDIDKLDAASPARHAGRIRAPILLVHGEKDFTVAVEHSHDMEHALRKARKSVTAIYIDNADHYRLQYDARFAWLKALDEFLALQSGPEQVPEER